MVRWDSEAKLRSCVEIKENTSKKLTFTLKRGQSSLRARTPPPASEAGRCKGVPQEPRLCFFMILVEDEFNIVIYCTISCRTLICLGCLKVKRWSWLILCLNTTIKTDDTLFEFVEMCNVICLSCKPKTELYIYGKSWLYQEIFSEPAPCGPKK